jgi:hypothetical protein
MSRPFGLPERRRILTVDEWRTRDAEPAVEPLADAVGGSSVEPDDVWYGVGWAGAGPEAQD